MYQIDTSSGGVYTTLQMFFSVDGIGECPSTERLSVHTEAGLYVSLLNAFGDFDEL